MRNLTGKDPPGEIPYFYLVFHVRMLWFPEKEKAAPSAMEKGG